MRSSRRASSTSTGETSSGSPPGGPASAAARRVPRRREAACRKLRTHVVDGGAGRQHCRRLRGGRSCGSSRQRKAGQGAATRIGRTGGDRYLVGPSARRRERARPRGRARARALRSPPPRAAAGGGPACAPAVRRDRQTMAPARGLLAGLDRASGPAPHPTRDAGCTRTQENPHRPAAPTQPRPPSTMSAGVKYSLGHAFGIPSNIPNLTESRGSLSLHAPVNASGRTVIVRRIAQVAEYSAGA